MTVAFCDMVYFDNEVVALMQNMLYICQAEPSHRPLNAYIYIYIFIYQPSHIPMRAYIYIYIYIHDVIYREIPCCIAIAYCLPFEMSAKISKYSWDQSDKFVSIYVDYEGAGALAPEAVQVEFMVKGVLLTVKGSDKTYWFKVPNLCKAIDVANSLKKVHHRGIGRAMQ